MARAVCALALWAGVGSLGAAPAGAQPYLSYPVGAGPVSIAAGDLNRDGRPDLVTANNSSNSVSVLLNRGAGRFDRVSDLAASGASCVAIADLNGDGVPDLVVTGNGVSVFRGYGDGTFGSGVGYSDSLYFSCAAVGDVNWDGRPDVVAGEFVNEVAVFPGHGDGTLGAPMYFDANPRDATATVSRPVAGSSTPPQPMKVIMISGVAIGDLDGGGWPDIAVSLDDPYSEFAHQVLLGNGDGTFRQATPIYDPGYSRSIAMADCNRDAWPDLAVANGGYQAIAVVLDPGNGAGGSASNLPTRSTPLGIAAGDLNRDGATDLVSSNYPGEVCVWLSNGAGGFGAPVYFATSEVPNAITIADLDGDGRADLATTDQNASTVSLLFGDGSGGFGGSPTVAVPQAARPGVLALERVHPNPARARATVRFTLPRAGRATLRVLDTAGRLVATLEDRFLPAGEHVAAWDGRGFDGATAAPGVYVCELRFEGRALSRTLAVIK
ncbi:MAG TPA: FG-GAP-like repeat-containing protein [Candidatus Eisenbacteria bacterium]